MVEREQINIKVRDEKKAKWKEYQKENPEYSSLTDLIRQAVEKEIAGNTSISPAPVDRDSGREVAEVKDAINAVQREVKALHGSISEVKEGINRPSPADEYLRSQIFAELPVRGSEERPKTPKEIAEKIEPDVDTSDVSNILADLEAKFGIVNSRLGNTPDDPKSYEREE